MARRRADGTAALRLDLMAVGLVVGKLAGQLDWPWWIVLSPVWSQFALMPFIGLRALSKHAERLKEVAELRWASKYTGCFGGLDVIVRLFLRLMRPHGPRPRRVFELFAAYMITGIVGLVWITFVVLALEGVLSSWVLAVGFSASLLAAGMMARSIGAAVVEDNAESASTADSSGTEEPQRH